MLDQKGLDQVPIFGRVHRAGGIHQLATGLEQGQQAC